MVIHESFVTRKPFEFTLIMLFIVFLLLLPVYFYTKKPKTVETQEIIPETFNEVNFQFSSDSELSASDKRMLFKQKYEGNTLQWSGTLLSCDFISDGMFRVSVDETSSGFGDVLFTTYHNCTEIPAGSTVTYRLKLIDWKLRSFVGKDGDVIIWE